MDVYESAVLAVGVVTVLAIMYGLYKSGGMITKKIAPEAPLWVTRVVGVLTVLLGMSIWNSLAG